MKLDQLNSFVRVVELGTFSAAAEQLRLTQPAVSLQVRELERKLGVRLLERVGKRATPTAAGIELLGYAKQIMDVCKLATDRMGAYERGTLGRVRIGTGATASIYLLPPILRELRRQFPTLQFTIETGNTANVLKSLEENALDLGFVTLPAPGRAFEVSPVMVDPFVALSLPDYYPLPERVTPEELSKFPLILYEAGGRTRQIVDRWFLDAGITPAPIMDLGNVEAIKALVGAGLGCAVLPASALRRDTSSVPIATRPLVPDLNRQLALVVRKDKPLYRGLRETLRAIQQLGDVQDGAAG